MLPRPLAHPSSLVKVCVWIFLDALIFEMLPTGFLPLCNVSSAETAVFVVASGHPQTFDLPVGAISQLLNVSLQMSPTPLKAFAIKIHLRSIAIQDDVPVVTNQGLERGSFPIKEDSKHGKHWCDGNPQPGFDILLFGRRLVDEELFLLRQFTTQLLIGSNQGIAHDILNLNGPTS